MPEPKLNFDKKSVSRAARRLHAISDVLEAARDHENQTGETWFLRSAVEVCVAALKFSPLSGYDPKDLVRTKEEGRLF